MDALWPLAAQTQPSWHVSLQHFPAVRFFHFTQNPPDTFRSDYAAPNFASQNIAVQDLAKEKSLFRHNFSFPVKLRGSRASVRWDGRHRNQAERCFSKRQSDASQSSWRRWRGCFDTNAVCSPFGHGTAAASAGGARAAFVRRWPRLSVTTTS